MKRMISMMTALSLFCAPAAFANEGHERMDVGKKVEKMKTKLGLSADQESQVKTVLEDYKARMEALKKEKQDKISAILTPEQRSKHEAMMKEWKDKEKKRDKNEKEEDED